MAKARIWRATVQPMSGTSFEATVQAPDRITALRFFEQQYAPVHWVSAPTEVFQYQQGSSAPQPMSQELAVIGLAIFGALAVIGLAVALFKPAPAPAPQQQPELSSPDARAQQQRMLQHQRCRSSRPNARRRRLDSAIDCTTKEGRDVT
jgi:hypothetical protein